LVTKTEKESSVKSAATTFPIVTRNTKANILTVIYADHSEVYVLKSTHTKADAEREGCTYNPESELEMDLNSGAEIVHCSKETRYYTMPKEFVDSVREAAAELKKAEEL